MNNAEVTMAMYFAEVITRENMTDRVQQLQLFALQELGSQLQYYRSMGIAEILISTIAEKKGRLILQTTSKAEMDAQNGAMDLILCASVSRFARNVADCMTLGDSQASSKVKPSCGPRHSSKVKPAMRPSI